MEPTGEAKESDVKEQITIVNGGRETVGEAVTRKRGMDKGFKSVSFRTINSQIYMQLIQGWTVVSTFLRR